MNTTADILLQQLFPSDCRVPLRKFTLPGSHAQDIVRVALEELSPSVKKGAKIRNCFVWIPADSLARIKTVAKFHVSDDIRDCDFYFFNIPDSRSKINFFLKGTNHKAIFFSRRMMKLTVKMVHQDCSLTIGENTYIGGATVVLLETSITVCAGGLWSDGVLLQGSDSHGIVDLDTQQIINDGAKHIMIDSHVWLGRNSTVMKNVRIGTGSIVATGALVVKDVKAACAVAGVPAKVVRERVSWSQSQTSITKIEAKYFSRLKATLDNKKEKQAQSSPQASSALKKSLRGIASKIRKTFLRRP